MDRVLGIQKAYVTRVGGGPFPTELKTADGGRRDRPQEKDVDADRQESGRQRLLQHVTGQTRILADDGAIAMGTAAEHLARSHTDAHRHLGGHRSGVGPTANAVRAEK
jgi:hypothetical protein